MPEGESESVAACAAQDSNNNHVDRNFILRTSRHTTRAPDNSTLAPVFRAYRKGDP